jgi:hypothetical protein
MVSYNRERWIEEFENRLLALRPHLRRDNAIDAVSTSAWHLCNAQADDPVRAAEGFSQMLDEAHVAHHSER